MLPGFLKQDDDGHWFFVPEDEVDEFNEALGAIYNGDEVAGWNLWETLNVQEIDGPHDQRVVLVPGEGMGEVSDGYHTFNELYEHR